MHKHVRKVTRRETLLKIGGGLSATILSPLCGTAETETTPPATSQVTGQGRRLLIKNGIVIDGSGKPGVIADVLIIDGLIAGIGSYAQDNADRVLDATGQVVCPGFIDLHTHCKNGDNAAFIYQGVTTVISGNCGFSATMKTLNADYQNAPKLTNMGNLVGHHTLGRVRAERALSTAELAGLEQILTTEMSAGAFGFSTGLAYTPGSYATTEEVIALNKIAAKFGGIYVSHIRDEGNHVLAAVAEAIQIGEASKTPVHISHHKVNGVENWGRSKETLALIDKAHARGMRVSMDQYPYCAWNGTLRLQLPAWALEGDEATISKRIAEPSSRARIKAYLVKNLAFYAQHPERMVLNICVQDPKLIGLNMSELAQHKGHKPDADGIAESMLELLHKDPSHKGAYLRVHAMDEKDVQRIMCHPSTAIASDAWSIPFNVGMPHPRHYGPFPRVLGHYSRDLKLFPLEEAVRKMTSLPADIMGLNKRGQLRQGYHADLVVFNPHTVIDQATFEKPHQYPLGITHVFVNGVTTLENGALTQQAGGSLLLKS